MAPQDFLEQRFLPGLLGLAAAAALAACSDDNDSVPQPLEAYGSSIDSTQVVAAPIAGIDVTVTLRNLAPVNGTLQTPVWVGFHDGQFDLYDSGSAASLFFPTSSALERLAEDGDNAPLAAEFTSQGFGSAQGNLAGAFTPGPLAPGEGVQRTFRLDPGAASSRYFSYASMVLPSNDAFIANGDPLAHEVFDGAGSFTGAGFTVAGADVLDAGTEVNDELPANTAFFGQATPDTGVDEMGLVGPHPGFLDTGMGGILDDPAFAAADFTAPGYEMLSVSFAESPAPGFGAGQASYTFNPDAGTLAYSVLVTGLSGQASALQLRNAALGADGALVLDLDAGISENAGGVLRASGQVSLDVTQVASLRAGELYLEVSTDLNPGGELRGQIDASAGFDTALEASQTVPAATPGALLRVALRNTAPANGTFQTPVWVGVHDGQFDLYDSGSPASTFFPVTNGLERLAEDGTLSNLQTTFEDSGFGAVQGVVAGAGGPLAPGELALAELRLDPTSASARYFSYASMVLPSNDAFVANGSPTAHEVFDALGAFAGVDFTVPGDEVLDAGTEVNDELPANTAFFGQATPDTGDVEGANVDTHPGFLTAAPGTILGDPMFAQADFKAPGYENLALGFSEGATPAFGSGQASVRPSAGLDQLEVEVTVAGLSGSATMLSINNAAAGAAGPVELDLLPFVTENAAGILRASGSIAIDPDQLAGLQAGNLYLSVHTALNPDGELRGQLAPLN